MPTPTVNRMTYLVNSILNNKLPPATMPVNYFNQMGQSVAGIVTDSDPERGSVKVSTVGGGDPQEYFLQNIWYRVGDPVVAAGGRAL